jgi:hypothetical protein
MGSNRLGIAVYSKLRVARRSAHHVSSEYYAQ